MLIGQCPTLSYLMLCRSIACAPRQAAISDGLTEISCPEYPTSHLNFFHCFDVI